MPNIIFHPLLKSALNLEQLVPIFVSQLLSNIASTIALGFMSNYVSTVVPSIAYFFHLVLCPILFLVDVNFEKNSTYFIILVYSLLYTYDGTINCATYFYRICASFLLLDYHLVSSASFAPNFFTKCYTMFFTNIWAKFCAIFFCNVCIDFVPLFVPFFMPNVASGLVPSFAPIIVLELHRDLC